MILTPEGLVEPARRAGIAVPPDPRNFKPSEYPYFDVFLTLQLGKPMKDPASHWKNAKVIASIHPDKIVEITVEDVWAMNWTE